MIYSGDEIALTNFYEYTQEEDKNMITAGCIVH